MKKILVILLFPLALTACATNEDPRNGPVVMGRENCLWGGCWRKEKVCIDDDLKFTIFDSGRRTEWFEYKSEECR